MEVMNRAMTVAYVQFSRIGERFRQIILGHFHGVRQRHARHERSNGCRQGTSGSMDVFRFDTWRMQLGRFSVAIEEIDTVISRQPSA